MCIWKVAEEDRRCEYCTYRGGCETHPEPTDLKDIEEVAGHYISVMSDIVGHGILCKTRTTMIVWARNMVAYQLRRDGYTVESIGDCLGLNHSTITHCQGRVRDMLSHPRQYVRETRIWQEFKERLSL